MKEYREKICKRYLVMYGLRTLLDFLQYGIKFFIGFHFSLNCVSGGEADKDDGKDQNECL
jgi:hypothetical protein